MASAEPTRQRIAMVVANRVVDDVRVLKCARTAADGGLDVLVIGYAPEGQRIEELRDGYRLVRLPRRGRMTAGSGAPGPAARALAILLRRLGRFRAWTAPSRVAVSLEVGGLRRRAWRRARARLSPRKRWTVSFPLIAELEPGCRQELERYAPDVVHAHDFTGLGLVGGAVRSMRREGRRVRLVYDAHEYVNGLDTLPRDRLRAACLLEEDLLPAADAVVTVSDELADALHHDHGLARKPVVVLNAPSRVRPARARSLRAAIGLSEDIPLLVYPGNVKPIRGLETVIGGLPSLPEVHLALIAPEANPHVGQLADCATRLGCGDRLHVTSYVRPAEVSAYIADATAGVNPLLRYGNADVALPNKVFEYLHAGLPMIVTDLKAVRRLVLGLGVGEVYPAGDVGGFITAAAQVMHNPADYRLDETARAQVLAELSWENQAASLLAVYAELLGRRDDLVPAAAN